MNDLSAVLAQFRAAAAARGLFRPRPEETRPGSPLRREYLAHQAHDIEGQRQKRRCAYVCTFSNSDFEVVGRCPVAGKQK